MRRRVLSGFLAMMAVFGAGLAHAQSSDREVPDMPEGCQVKDASKIIRVLVCSDGPYDEGDYVAAGRAACGADLPCGAWIWQEAAGSPARAPENHDGLTQSEIASSTGVWVAEQQSFISIEALKN